MPGAEDAFFTFANKCPGLNTGGWEESGVVLLFTFLAPYGFFLTINNTHTIINTPSGCIRDHKRVPSGYIKMASLFHSARMKLRRGQSMMAKFGGISVSDPDMFV